MEAVIKQGTQAGRTGVLLSALTVLKPGIALGVSVAGLAGMVLTGKGMPGPGQASLVVLCILTAAMGSAGLNVVAETRTDRFMARLSGRNAALSKVGRPAASVISLALILLSLSLSCLLINAVTCLLVLAAVLSYTVMYTLYAKRTTPFGTVLGGIPGALPVLIGYAAVKPGLGLDGMLLFALMLLWQQPHFLALALKYEEEYAAAGIPVMPSAMGEGYTKAFMLAYAAALAPLVISLWLFGLCSAGFALAGTTATAVYLAVSSYDILRTRRYGRAFGASIVYIMAIFACVIIDLT